MTKAVFPVLLVAVCASVVFAAAGGYVWEPLSAVPAIRGPYVDDLYIAGKYGVALVHHRWLWLSEDHGQTWTRQIDLRDAMGLALPMNRTPTAVALRGPRIYVGGTDFLATYDGTHWTYVTPQFENVGDFTIMDIAAPKTASSKAYAVGWFRRPGDAPSVRRPLVVRTTDNGATWERWGTPPVEPGAGDETTLVAVAVARDKTVVVSGTHALLAQRKESGGPWQDLHPPGGWGSLTGVARVAPALAVGGGTANHIIWAGRRDGKVIIKRGNNPWQIYNVAANFFIRDIAFRTSNEGALIGYESTLTQFRIYATKDGGKTWVPQPIDSRVKATNFNIEASASNHVRFIADAVIPEGPTNSNCAWLMFQKFTLHIPPKFREPLMRRPIPIPGPGPIERMGGRVEEPVQRAPQQVR